MSEFLHGAYGVVATAGNRVTERGDSEGVFVYIGTAPIHNRVLGEGESYPVNKVIVCNNMAEAKAALGYSDAWEDFTLCEAMKVHFDQNGVGPIAFINVLDPTKAAHKSATATTVEKTPASGKITITSAGSIITESIVIQTQDDTPVTKVKGTDYTLAYNEAKKQIIIESIGAGLGTDALNVSYYTIKPSGVVAADIVGTTDDMGLNTGLYCLNDVYPGTGLIPAYLAAPGFSSDKTVHDAMYERASKINGHWDAYIFADLPLMDGSTPLTLATVATYKETNGWNKENEKVFFPMILGTDNKKYHLSVLYAANFQSLLIKNDGIPYMTASNTECPIIQNLWMGATNTGRLYDDAIINKYLNANGITSACYNAGAWRLWGSSSAEYTQANATQVNVSEINVMMLFYVSNDFQARRAADVDRPMTANDIITIAAEEQTRIDALLSIGALILGRVAVNATAEAKSDIMMGDFSFRFDITPTPIAKSLTAYVNWTDEGFTTYYEAIAAA